ncbi:MFS transporter [Enterobacter ludwigii]|uniref:MFS transporter n=1 Tax=Enterobacter ludwigii TaxID=299767 RepID=UPI003F73046C
MSDIARRIEQLPFCGFHKKLLVIGGLGYTFDAMETSSLAFVLPVISKVWGLTSFETGLIASSTSTGVLFGALFAGLCGDYFGRRVVMMSALMLFCLASLASAGMEHWQSFYVCRLFVGFGGGAESAIVAPFLSEFIAKKYRGAFIGSLAGFFSFGYILSAILGNLLVPHFAEGWRYMLIITSLPVFILLWWRRTLPESPLWLQSCGRHDEARATMRNIEQAVLREGLRPGQTRSISVSGESLPAQYNFLTRLKAIWSAELWKTTMMSWMMWFSVAFSYYTFSTWFPTLLVQTGMELKKSLGYSLLMYVAQLPGYFSVAYLNQRFGQRKTLISYMCLSALSAALLAVSHDPLAVVSAGISLSFFMNGAFGGVYAYTPGLFPTSLRATGMGASSSFGRLGAIAAPVMVGILFPVMGFAGVFSITTAVLIIGAAAVLIPGASTKRASPES